MNHPSLFESVFNSSPIGNYLLSPTPDAIILAVNDTFLKASSRTREELVGMSLFAAFPRNPDDPEDRGEIDLRRSLACAVDTAKPDSLPAIRYPIRVELPNGEVVFEERFWSAVSTPIFGEDGSIVCISHTTSDVTEQVRAAAALRESEKRFRALTSATADVIYRMSPDWTQVRQLEGRGFIKDTADPNEMWLDEYIPQGDHDLVHQAIDEAVSNKQAFELEHRVRRIDGSIGWTLSRAVPMLDAHGAIYEWIGAASDITERKEAEAKLRDTDRRKDEFVAMLAHELRNPLAPIRAAAELLQMAHQDPQRVRQTSQIITRQVMHMTNLINDLLDVSRVTNGLVTLDKAPLNIRHVLMEAVEQVTPLMQSRQHHLAIHLPPGSTVVSGDAKRLVQVMTNILSNAAKYTPARGNIELRTEVHPSQVLITVTDNGIGMAPELTGRVFDLFTQDERTSDRSSGGLGLGLALVKSLVELHGGTVSCESPGPGEGSRFTVGLPRQDAGDQVLAPQAAEHGAGVAAAPLRIMVVDDNVDAATMLAILLEAAGHQVTVEHRPEDALERIREARPQVCLLDIGLPGMDGHELARRLRQLPETADALLVAVTGYGQEETRAHALASGFDHYFVKPIDMAALHQLLAAASAG
ncbi:ATP-binding protein [Massilia sp. ZL223]|uniref:PAS domain-containing hybrid sensor histidine kinase/response regulator n=1 Tax=Massilia sp. ZL223 TaxID=2824904 RepID=UPI001B8290FD|nr:ATP-binding protein [Massilia sp. ZL223]MBQ5965618.1 response regulator [Massilia sp. ZL223]